MIDNLYLFLSRYGEPLTSPFLLLGILLLLSILNKYKTNEKIKILSTVSYIIFFAVIYSFAIQYIHTAKWLARLNSFFIPVITFIVLPAIYLPRNKRYKFFLILPLLCIIFAVLEIINQYSKIPSPKQFIWFLIRPPFLIAAMVSFLVIAQNYLTMDRLRKLTRLTMLVVLVYGGFLFRKSFVDYNEMLERRGIQKKDIISLSDTMPVITHTSRLSYIPSAPCRFTADGGYVQGCVMELLQRFMQINLIKVHKGNNEEVAVFSIVLAAVCSILVLLFIGARFWCGWICPLSTLGDAFDFLRRMFKLPHFKLFHNLKQSFFYGGVSLATISLLLAKGYAHVNKDGFFLGCKIPLYPFCKICPGQQVCPVASKGPSGYPPLAGTEWLFGFLKLFAIILVIIFVISFIAARRLWCYFCPMGLIGGLFNKNSLIAINKDAQKCNGCGVCNDVCPMDIHKVQREMEKEDVTSFDCLFCLKCIDNCPKDKCLSLKYTNKTIITSEW